MRDAPDIWEWANAGPGAVRGLDRLTGRALDIKPPKEQTLVEMQHLLQLSQSLENWSGPALEMRCIEHNLCELDKFQRAASGVKHNLRRYHPPGIVVLPKKPRKKVMVACAIPAQTQTPAVQAQQAGCNTVAAEPCVVATAEPVQAQVGACVIAAEPCESSLDTAQVRKKEPGSLGGNGAEPGHGAAQSAQSQAGATINGCEFAETEPDGGNGEDHPRDKSPEPESEREVTLLDRILEYIGNVWCPVPIPFKEKRPTLEGWPALRITATDAPRHFDGRAQNVGVMLGPQSNNLVDIDLDCSEALIAAPYFIPETGAAFGHASKRRSHLLFYSEGLAADVGKGSLPFKDPNLSGDEAMLLEVRCGGGGKAAQSVFPGSVHASGESIDWEAGCDGEPAEIDSAELLKAAAHTAAACLLARYWPAHGARHDAALRLGGWLARNGMPADDAERLAEVVAMTAGVDASGIADTVRGVKDGIADWAKGVETIYGYTAMKETFGEKTVEALTEWLGFGVERTHTWTTPRAIPEGLPPVLPFEPGFLPDAVSPWVVDIAERMQCPLDYVGASVGVQRWK